MIYSQTPQHPFGGRPGVFNPAGFPRIPSALRPGLPHALPSDLPLLQAAMAAQTPASGRKRTLIVKLLDESGSMTTGADQTRKAYNDQLALIRANAEEVGAEVTQINFNSDIRLLASHMQASQLIELTPGNYVPSGGTALYDAVAAAIKYVLGHPNAACADTAVMLYVFTDGDDTSSGLWGDGGYTNKRASSSFRALMHAVRNNPRWTVALAGPDTRLAQFADEMAVDSGNVAAFKPESVASRMDALAGSAHAFTTYLNARTEGALRSANLYAGTAAHALAMSCLQQAAPN